MTIYGYCRVSTPKQKLERQANNILEAYPDIKLKNIYCDEWTGSSLVRPRWNQLLKRLKEGDTVVFDSVSRMSRNAAEGFELYERLYKKGISIVFLKDPTINTDCYKEILDTSLPDFGNEDLKPLMDGLKETIFRLRRRQFIIAFEQAEKEVEDLRQRTKEGFTAESRRKMSERSKANKGRKLTTKKSLELKPQIRELSKAFDGIYSDKKVIEFLKMRPATYYKYKKELKEEIAKEKGE